MVIPRVTTELRLLADPTRARILSLIMQNFEGRMLVGTLATELQLRQPTVSHHVKALCDQGWLERTPDGRTVWYSISPERADRVSDVLHAAQEPRLAEGVLARISADLGGRFAGTFAPETVDRYVRESYALLAEQSRITRYLPSLTSRFAADRLSALATADVPRSERVAEVLFVCVQNAGRSQMASAILRHLAGNRVNVRSAGSAPATAVHSIIIAALDEIGVPIGGEYPKPLTDDVVRAADFVITMGCGDACPVYAGRRYLDWNLTDPVGLPLTQIREIRDDIVRRVWELLATLNLNTL